MVGAMIWAIALWGNSDRDFLRKLKFRSEIQFRQFMTTINIQKLTVKD